MWIIKRTGSGTSEMCLRGELGEMHTLIERPPGQLKYLEENENFILGFFFMKHYFPKL